MWSYDKHVIVTKCQYILAAIKLSMYIPETTGEAEMQTK